MRRRSLKENMARVALLSHARPKSKKTKTHISKVLSDHAVANTWWEPSSIPEWLTEQSYVERIQPRLKAIKVREIAETMHISKPYAALVRAGEYRIPGTGRSWPNWFASNTRSEASEALLNLLLHFSIRSHES